MTDQAPRVTSPADGPPSHSAEGKTEAVVDITIIGGGPTGLFALFYAGMRGATARIVDALPEVGGQLTALYPEKYIFDVAGYPKVLAKDLVRALADQANQFGHPTFLNQRVEALEEDGGVFTLVTATHWLPSRAIVVAAGIGAFSPRRLPQSFAGPWYGRGIHASVSDPEEFRGQRVVIIGGGDSAFDWAHQLAGRAQHVTLVHRSDRFRAHAATIRAVEDAVAAGRAEILTYHELHGVLGTDVPEDGARLRGLVVRDTKQKTTREIEADAILPMLGYVSDLGPVLHWGLTITNHEIVVIELDGDRPAGDLRGGGCHHLSGEAQAHRHGVRRGCNRDQSGRSLDLSGEESGSGAQLEHGLVRAKG